MTHNRSAATSVGIPARATIASRDPILAVFPSQLLCVLLPRNRHLRNTKKKERMSNLRAQQALDAPEVIEARRLAAREASRKYRETHRDVLALKAQARRADDKLAQERAYAALERKRRRELLPLAVPSSYTPAQRAAAAAEHARRQAEYIAGGHGRASNT
ncbi:hypothetical protein DFH06DRAFT_1139062 [Mycena polygramma]|nr:hypothetical protein DFH06DRAFT_1139062 [Mycena polygramma]